MKQFRDETGQTLVLTALLMCVLMGFMALSIDMGVAFRAQRRLQTQADAAATAAALCGTYGGNFCKQFGGTDAPSVASGAAIVNGMSSSAVVNGTSCNGSLNTCISIHTSPGYGQHTGSGWYEAIITTPSAAPFMGTFSGLFNGGSTNYAPLTVGARAVAGMVPGQSCMYVLNQTDHHALYVKGGSGGSKAPATIYAPVCSIQVNSIADDALCTTGNNATIDSQQIIVVGGQNGAGKCNGTQDNVQTGGGSGGDPFAGMTNPSKGCPTGTPPTGNLYGWGGGVTDTLSQNATTGVITLTNGSTGATQTVTTAGYSPTGTGGPSVNVACFSDAVKLTTDLGTDTNSAWVFQNGLNVGGSSHLTINGTVDITGGTLQEANTDFFINGPTGLASSDPYTGMALIATATGPSADGCDSSVKSMGTVPSTDGCLQLQFGSGGSTLTCSTTDIANGKCNCTAASGQPGILGTIYAPNDVVYMQDSGSCVSATNLIADEIWDNGALSIYNYNLAYTTSPLDVVRLVE
jgi:Flp pilus assembly protein TadG